MKKQTSHILLQYALMALLALALPSQSWSQEATESQKEYLRAPIKRNGFSEEAWKKAITGLDYKEKKSPKPPKGINTPSFGPTLVKIFIILVIAVALGLLIAYFSGINWAPPNRKIKNSLEGGINVNRIEEQLQEADFNTLISEAVGRSEFALALRLYFLWALQSLSRQEIIQWRKEKTNRDYLREVKPTAIYEPFRQATLDYETVWYGQQALHAVDYERLAPQFASLIKAVEKMAKTPSKL